MSNDVHGFDKNKNHYFLSRCACTRIIYIYIIPTSFVYHKKKFTVETTSFQSPLAVIYILHILCSLNLLTCKEYNICFYLAITYLYQTFLNTRVLSF